MRRGTAAYSAKAPWRACKDRATRPSPSGYRKGSLRRARIEALAAIDRGIESYPVIKAKSANAFAQRRHFAGGFVPNHRWRNAAAGGPIESMHVTAANAAGADRIRTSSAAISGSGIAVSSSFRYPLRSNAFKHQDGSKVRRYQGICGAYGRSAVNRQRRVNAMAAIVASNARSFTSGVAAGSGVSTKSGVQVPGVDDASDSK